MTPERGAVDAGVKIRAPRHVWIPQLVMGGAFLVVGPPCGAMDLWMDLIG